MIVRGEVIVQGFSYGAQDVAAEGPNGPVQGRAVRIQDDSGLNLVLLFGPGEAEEFCRTVEGRQVLVASTIPRAATIRQ